MFDDKEYWKKTMKNEQARRKRTVDRCLSSRNGWARPLNAYEHPKKLQYL